MSWLSPAGPGAAGIATLTWWLFALGGLVYAVVLAALLTAARRGDRRPPDDAAATARRERGARWLIAAGAVVTVLIVCVILGLGLAALAAAPPADPAPLTIEVIGHQWWWAVRYLDGPSGDVTETANEIHVPVGRTVEVRLSSRDVIHSFWVPELQGKLDLIPGKTNLTWLRAERPGVYRGLCAEYCGLQHARMGLLVVAEPAAIFEAWLERERAPAVPPRDEEAARGERLFVDRGCAFCHAVRGSPAFFGREGPDLTHVAGRRTLAAATLANVPGHLAGWVANPQALKPGTRMPRVPLEPPELHAVVHYLRGLR